MRVLAGAFAVALLGCASIVSKSTYPVVFDTNPTGGQIVITDHAGVRVFQGRTPTTVTLSARKGFFQGANYTIQCPMEGHTETTTLTSSLDGWYIGNILFGGLIGILIVDPATGAMWKLDDRAVLSLGHPVTGSDPGQAALQIIGIDQIPREYRGRLARIE